MRPLLTALVIAALSASGNSESGTEIAKAQQLFGQHKISESLKVLKEAVKKDPDCARCYIEIAFENLQIRNVGDAMKALESATKAGSDDKVHAAAHRYKGLVLLNGDKKEIQQAEGEFRQALALDASVVETRFSLGLALLRLNREADGLAEIRAYLDLPGKKDQELFAKKLLAKPLLASETIAPEFKIQTVDGRDISLADNEGKIVVIDFWATWCPPCRESVPEIKELVAKYPPDKLLVISASADEDEKAWREFIAKKQMTWPQYHDKDGTLSQMFQVHAFPTYVVIDRDGFIRRRLVGKNPQQSIAYQLKAELKSLLE